MTNNLLFRTFLDAITNIFFSVISISQSLYEFFSMSIVEAVHKYSNGAIAIDNAVDQILAFLRNFTLTPNWIVDMYEQFLTAPLILFLFGSGLTIFLILSIIKWIIGIFT